MLTFAIGLLLLILVVTAAWRPTISVGAHWPRPCQPALVVSFDGARLSIG